MIRFLMMLSSLHDAITYWIALRKSRKIKEAIDEAKNGDQTKLELLTGRDPGPSGIRYHGMYKRTKKEKDTETR